MKLLNQKNILQVSGGDGDIGGGFNLVYVSVNISNPSAAPAVSSLVGRLMDGQLAPSSLAQAISDAGGSLVEYLYISPNQ